MGKRFATTGMKMEGFPAFQCDNITRRRISVKEMSRAGPKKGAQNQPCQPRSFQGMSEKEEKFKQNQVQ